MNCYFELTDWFVPEFGSKYIAFSSPTASHTVRFIRLIAISNRIWLEDDSGNVTFLKNRKSAGGTMIDVDLKEFFWVKLKCEWNNYKTYSALSQW